MAIPESRFRRWRRRLTRWAIRVALGLAVLLIVREIVVTILWHRFAAAQDRVGEELKRRDGRRLPLAGPVEPGNAWDDYVAAAALVEVRPGYYNTDSLDRAFSPDQKAGDDLKAMAALRDGESVLRLVERGSRRESCSIPFDRTFYRSNNGPSYGALHYLGTLGAARTRQQAARHDIEGALASAATGLQFALDVARGPSQIHLSYGAGILESATDAVRVLSSSSQLDGDQIKRLAVIIAAVEERVPSPYRELASYERDFWLFRKNVAEEFEFPAGVFRAAAWFPEPRATLPPWWTLWRYGFSYRLAILSDMRFRSDVWTRLLPTGGQPWKIVGPVLAGARKDVRAMVNPTVPDWSGPNLYWDQGLRIRLAHLRLLRASLLLRSGGRPGVQDWPEDPFTREPLRLRELDGVRVIWSEGPDGDQGGVGGWRYRDESDDILLVVEEGS